MSNLPITTDENISKISQSQSIEKGSLGDSAKTPDDDHFLEAYQKIKKKEVARLNRLYRKNKDNIEYVYSHPGTFREFDFDEKVKSRMNTDDGVSGSPRKKKEKEKLWSCCLNADEHSKGCQKTIVKKFKWIYDGP